MVVPFVQVGSLVVTKCSTPATGLRSIRALTGPEAEGALQLGHEVDVQLSRLEKDLEGEREEIWGCFLCISDVLEILGSGSSIPFSLYIIPRHTRFNPFDFLIGKIIQKFFRALRCCCVN